MEREEAEAIFGQGREAVVAVLVRMDDQIERLTERVARQDERIAQLERKVKRSSRNSSQPPSQDHPPSAGPERGKGPSGRGQGAQPGHQGRGRGLLAASAVDERVEHWPVECDCGHVFCEADRVAAGDPARHQVEELPVMAVRVTEHRGQRVRCPDCGERRTAALPAEVAASAFGPRLQAAVATLSVRNRISRRDVVELCEQLFCARISIGSVEAILQRASDALAEPYEDLLEEIRLAAHLNMDETGWRLRGRQRALWGAFTERHAVLRIAPDRHEDHAKALLGPAQAIVTWDRWWAYGHLPLKRRQVCWSHLQRDFASHADGLAAEKELGEHGLRICEELFWSWEIFQHTGDRTELKRRIRALRRELKPILRQHAGKAARYRHSRRFARNLLKIWPALWTFTDHRGVQPTNNHAERALRGAVITHKLSLGSQSTGGERRTERLLSAHTTCRLQRRSLHAYLVDLLAAHARGDPAPLLS
ncbi:MAG: IS66 family transposase [Pseudonocardiales bacterium]|nr:MAG: IS66 family transposase [Pseudonocardiales bacterium]